MELLWCKKHFKIDLTKYHHYHDPHHHTFIDVPTSVHYLFSVEQKNVTQGLRTVLSDDGGKYMASEKQVSNNLSNSVLERISNKSTEVDRKKSQQHLKTKTVCDTDVAGHSGTQRVDSPVQVMDVVERWGLCKAHPCLPDVFTAVYRLHAFYWVLDLFTKNIHRSNYFIVYLVQQVLKPKGHVRLFNSAFSNDTWSFSNQSSLGIDVFFWQLWGKHYCHSTAIIVRVWLTIGN